MQVETFLVEWDRLTERVQRKGSTALVSAGRALAEEAKREVHTYLNFR